MSQIAQGQCAIQGPQPITYVQTKNTKNKIKANTHTKKKKRRQKAEARENCCYNR